MTMSTGHWKDDINLNVNVNVLHPGARPRILMTAYRRVYIWPAETPGSGRSPGGGLEAPGRRWSFGGAPGNRTWKKKERKLFKYTDHCWCMLYIFFFAAFKAGMGGKIHHPSSIAESNVLFNGPVYVYLYININIYIYTVYKYKYIYIYYIYIHIFIYT